MIPASDGLERLLRFIQAFLHIIVALAASHAPLVSRVAGIPVDHELFRGLAELRGLLGSVRRFLRFFRFFDAFTSSYSIFMGMMNSDGQKDAAAGRHSYLLQTLDALAGTFNGMYLFLESLTLADALNIQGLAVLGKEAEYYFKIESQRCWFLALACGALACLIRLQSLNGQSSHEQPATEKANGKWSPGKGVNGHVKFTDKEKEESLNKQAQISAQRQRLTRKLAASLLDLPLPGSVIGWIPASPVVVGSLMLITSFLTGLDVWQRCGKEVGKL